MSHKSLEQSAMNAKNSAGLGQLLSLVTLPVLVGLVTLRKGERQLGALGQFSESLLQGEQLPILKKVFGRTE